MVFLKRFGLLFGRLVDGFAGLGFAGAGLLRSLGKARFEDGTDLHAGVSFAPWLVVRRCQQAKQRLSQPKLVLLVFPDASRTLALSIPCLIWFHSYSYVTASRAGGGSVSGRRERGRQQKIKMEPPAQPQSQEARYNITVST